MCSRFERAMIFVWFTNWQRQHWGVLEMQFGLYSRPIKSKFAFLQFTGNSYTLSRLSSTVLRLLTERQSDDPMMVGLAVPLMFSQGSSVGREKLPPALFSPFWHLLEWLKDPSSWRVPLSASTYGHDHMQRIKQQLYAAIKCLLSWHLKGVVDS